jgi:hypothetical protein
MKRGLPYNSYRSYLKQRFGKPVIKVPLDGGFSCPNRDGTVGSRGCSFCDNRAFSPAVAREGTAVEQLERAVERHTSRDVYFLPYLQPFSNTYGSLERIKSVYEPLLHVPGVIGLAIGTRPDCFTPEIYDYLSSLARRWYLCVELGLQSSHDSTLQRNNRGHPYETFVSAVDELEKHKIQTAVHVILGMPGDTESMIYETACRLASLPVHGIKLHQLMIIRGTAVYRWYERGEVEPLSLASYATLVGGFLRRLDPDQVIHRLMADSRESAGLVAPLWSGEKGKSIAYIQQYLSTCGIVQGELYSGKAVGEADE